MLDITVNGYVASVRRPAFGDLVAYESARRHGDDFQAKIALFKRINETMGTPLPKPIQVSVAAAALRNAGDELAVIKLDEEDLSAETADLFVAAQEKCLPSAFSIGAIQVVCREPASDVLQVYYKTSDSSVLTASRAMSVWCMQAMGKDKAEAAAKALDERYPAAYVSLANALAEIGGLTAAAEVRER